EAFLGEVEWSYGFATRLLSGEEEALMTLRGVATDEELTPETVVLDVGGGSTELIALDRRVSLDIGSGRLTEQFLHSDPPTASEHDLLTGTALAAAELPEPAEGDAPPGAYTCC